MAAVGMGVAALRRRTLLAAVVGAIGFGAAAHAWAGPDPVDLTVIDRETGQALTPWRHDGRLFVAGEPGARYGLRVSNHTGRRVLVVMSVDGVNILTGETARYDQRGYVLDPWESYVVNGWRKSNTEVAAFAFAPLPQSYAARTGRPGDVGVIGMAVFEERVPVQAALPPPAVEAPRPMAPLIRPDDARSRAESGSATITARRSESFAFATPTPPIAQSPAAANLLAQRPAEKLGTAHGAREWSLVHDVAFERATSYPISIRQVEYDTFDNLVAAGVIPPSPYGEHRPRPFPGGAGFVPDPPGRR